MFNMKIVAIIISVFISLGVCSQSVNQLNSSGKKEGKYIKYYDNNKVRYEGQFQNGVPTGLFKHYYYTGQLSSELQYSDDGVIAHNISYYTNGKKMAEGKYVDQQKDSIWNYYLNEEENPLVSIETYRFGKLHGESITYYPDSGKPAEIVEFKDGTKHGKLIKYFPDGVLMTESYYLDGMPHGDFVHYHPDGKVQIRGEYYKGVQTGDWEYYDEDGNPVSEEEFTRQDEVEAKHESGDSR